MRIHHLMNNKAREMALYLQMCKITRYIPVISVGWPHMHRREPYMHGTHRTGWDLSGKGMR